MRVAALPMALDDQPRASPTSRTPLLPFELADVRLEPLSRFGVAQRTNAAFLRLLDTDRLLFFFRRLANLPQPRATAQPYGGWESQGSGLRGEFTGHYLHAAAAVAAAGDDVILRERCEHVVRILEECQDAAGDGYLSAFPQSEFATVEDFKSRAPWVPCACALPLPHPGCPVHVHSHWRTLGALCPGPCPITVPGDWRP